MSVTPAAEPICSSPASRSAVAAIIDARSRDVGGYPVRRLLPSRARRLVGPFIFFDHMGGPRSSLPARGSTCHRIRTSASPP